MSKITRVRGVRSPVGQGSVLARSDGGTGPVTPHKTQGGILAKKGKLALQLSGDVTNDTTGKTTVGALAGVPLDVSPLTNGFVLGYNSGTGNLELQAGGGSGATAFTGLSDVPASYSGAALKAVRVNASATGLEFYTPSSGGSTTFIGLTDVPASYTGQTLKAVRVNAGETALEFYTPSSGGGGFEGSAAKAVLANFSWVNQGTATASDTTAGIVVNPAVHSGAAPTLQLLVQSPPTAPFDIYARFNWETPSLQFAEIGMVCYNSSNGRLVKCTLLQDNSPFQWFLQRWTNPTTFSATPATTIAMSHAHFWMRMHVTSTVISFYVSPNGYSWRKIFDETIATFLTAAGGSLDKIGALFGAPQNNVDTYTGVLNCWDTSAPV